MALAERVREYDVLREQVAVFAENVGNFSKFGAENANQLLFLRGQSAKTSDITELAQLANDEFARKMADFEKLQSENSGLTEQILTLQVKLATLQAELGAQNDAFSASQTQNNLNLKKLEILSLQNAALQRQVGGAERQGEALVSLEQSNKQNIELIQKLQNQNEKVNLKLVQLTEISQNQDGNALSEILTEQYQNIPFCLYEYCVENNVVNPKTSAKLKMKLLQDKMQLQAISKELKIDMKGLKYTILDRAGDDGKMSDIEYLLHCVKTMKVKISEKLDNFITYVNDRFDEDKNNVLASFEILKVKLEAV
ncbi:hypothetical protein SS50377_26161 [Spironucleus salmonicida]|nr:hypothetical protein SS50377_26161 [Spironucleus salmonicida]